MSCQLYKVLEVSHSGRLHGTVNPAPFGVSVVQIHLPPPILARSYNGHYFGLSIRLWEFDSPTSRQVLW